MNGYGGATPRPWRIAPQYPGDPFAPVCIVGHENSRPVTAPIAKFELDDAPERDWNAEQEANARLIVAAVNSYESWAPQVEAQDKLLAEARDILASVIASGTVGTSARKLLELYADIVAAVGKGR